jgi:hypothetical protein
MRCVGEDRRHTAIGRSLWALSFPLVLSPCTTFADRLPDFNAPELKRGAAERAAAQRSAAPSGAAPHEGERAAISTL